MARRFRKATGEPPAGGRKLTNKFWKDAEAPERFSVNCSRCQKEPACSILLQPGRHEFERVALILLEGMSRLIGHTLGTIYDPVGDNLCHYNLISLDSSGIGFLMAMRDAIDEFEASLPAGLPAKADEAAAMQEKLAAFDDAFRLIYPSSPTQAGKSSATTAPVAAIAHLQMSETTEPLPDTVVPTESGDASS